jgi:putative MATE family efflux protein
MVTISLYGLVNTFWVAKLGYQAVAALTSIMPFFIFCIAIGLGTGVGVNALASRRFGERNLEEANRVAGQTFFICLVSGLFLLLVTNLFPRQILLICGAPEDVLDMGEQYLRILGFGLPLYIFSIISRNIFQASGDAIRPMIFIIIGQVVNAVLDPFFIFGWGPFPQMGIGGAALATGIACGLSSLLSLGYILKGKTSYHLKFNHCRPNFRIIKDIYRVGLPSMLMELTGGIGFAVFNHVAAGYGSIVLAAVGIAGRISDLAFMPMVGMSHGLLPIIGFSLGAKNWTRLWGSLKLAVIWLVILMLAATVCLEIFTAQVIGLFSSDPELLKIGVPGMRIFCATLALIGPLIMFTTTLQGLSKGTTAMLLSLCHQFIFFIPGLLIWSHYLGLTGVWISMPVSDALGFTIATLMIVREYRLQKKNPYWQTPPTPASQT